MWSALVLIALTQANPVCWKVSGVTKCVPEGNRVTHGEHTARAGGRSGINSAPFFQFAPTAGTGLGTACACTAVTGAKGETVTWTRGSSAYCSPLGLATTGITAGSMVLCGSNLPRVESDGTVNGILVEQAATEDAIQTEDFSNAAWTSTATVTANTTTPPAAVGSKISDADTLSDASGAAVQSSCQTIVTASATKHVASVFLTAGTIAAASIRMTGTGSSTGDCVTSTTALGATYTRLSCVSPAAYAGTLTAVTVCVEVGTVVGDTGTVIAWGANHVNTIPYLVSYIAASTAAVTRATDANAVNGNALGFPGAPFSLSAYITPEWGSATLTTVVGIVEGQVGTASGAGFFLPATNNLRIQTLNAGSANISPALSPVLLAGTTYKLSAVNSGGNSTVYESGTIIGGPTATNNTAQPWSTTTGIGYSPAFPAPLDGIISRVCVDSSSTKCVP